MVTLSLDSTGQLVFVLLTGPNDPTGVYWIRVTVVSQAQQFTASELVREQAVTLSDEEDQHSDRPPEAVPEVHAGNATKVFVSIVRR